ncbi:glutamate [NMDA] receptor subunit 3A [Elysia marginata]|uniref:Glutamate [NMDA] receptor subunit 3A n=1 Tax=Elysia marginata TaxID=1093978 RepID=A0AAV4G191_9GAST|nr:glutamate [NMDA] receptor subunit 3A [Elysia marginata]
MGYFPWRGDRREKIDVYMDDMPLLEYALARYDDTCNVRFAGKGFGSDGYAFGLPRFSWLKIPMSNQIRRYTESGYIQELAAKYLSRPRCENFLIGTAKPYGLEHTGGLFIILLSAVVLSVMFLILEHLAYKYLVPWLRRQPIESFWKRESFAFISQRVFRVVRSERLYSQKQAAQEMIKIVKQRDFTRLIQKNELQKRRMPTQKRVKTKAEVFQEITANIVSYHRQMQSASEDPETLDGSDLDEEYLKRVDSGPNDASMDYSTEKDGIQNVAFSAGSSSCSTVGSRRRQGYRANTMLSIDDDDNVVFVEDSVIEEGDEYFWAGPKRKGSSRSFVVPPQASQRSLPRKFSDCPYPPWVRSQHGSHVLSLSSRFRRPSLSSFKASTSPPTSPILFNSGNNQINVSPRHDSGQAPPYANNFSVIFNDDGISLNTPRPLPEGGNVANSGGEVEGPSQPSVITPDLPPETPGRYYYYSPTSSSNQTLSEERREFSPLSSPTTPHTDEEFPGCLETSFTGSMSSLKPGQKATTSSGISTHWNPHQTHRGFESLSPTKVFKQDARLDPVRLSSSDDLARLSPVHENQPRVGSGTSALCSTESGPNSTKFSPATLEHDQLFDYHSLSRQEKRATADRRNGDSKPSSAKDAQNDEEGGRPVKLKRNNSAVFTIQEEPGSRGLQTFGGSQHRRASLDSGQINNSRRSRALGDYFRRNLCLKDNRVKSGLRTPSMSGHHSHLAVDHIDKCTLEALSKEDVLILWKRSEFDLESRLHEVLARNRRLNLAIDYLTRPENTEQTEDV